MITRERRERARAVGLAMAALVAACGGSEPKPKGPEPEAQAAPTPEAPKPNMTVSAELGEIDQAEADRTFQRLQPRLMGCYMEGQKRIEYLSGEVHFFVRVGQDGTARWAYLEESTLGDRDSERCMLDLVTAAHWPRPSGGDAEVRNPIVFEPPGNVRRPVAWSSDRIAAALGSHGDDAAKCKKGMSGNFKVTAYVEPAGKHGKVQAAGVAFSNKDANARAECIVDAVLHMKMPSPGSYTAKVSFIL
jgi:hypothetical protein